jgi:hypothetical protein
MTSSITPFDGGTRLVIALTYNLSAERFGRLLDRALAGPYVRWCLRGMASDARAALGAAE